jgi:hypothetical protein
LVIINTIFEKFDNEEKGKNRKSKKGGHRRDTSELEKFCSIFRVEQTTKDSKVK